MVPAAFARKSWTMEVAVEVNRTNSAQGLARSWTTDDRREARGQLVQAIICSRVLGTLGESPSFRPADEKRGRREVIAGSETASPQSCR